VEGREREGQHIGGGRERQVVPTPRGWEEREKERGRGQHMEEGCY